MNPKMEELIELEKEKGDVAMFVLPFALIGSAVLMFVSTMMGVREHNLTAYFIGMVGFLILIVGLNKRKKLKLRIKELRSEL